MGSATKRTASRRRPRPVPVARVLFAAAQLPANDQLRIAARWRWERIVTECHDSTPGIASHLGVSNRHAQRLRKAFELAEAALGSRARRA